MTNDPVDHEASAVAQMANQIRDEEDGRAMEALERLAARESESFTIKMNRVGAQPTTVDSMLMSEASYRDIVHLGIANGVADDERAKMAGEDYPHSMGAMVEDRPCPDCEPRTEFSAEATKQAFETMARRKRHLGDLLMEVPEEERAKVREAVFKMGRQSGKTEMVTELFREHPEALIKMLAHREGMSTSTALAASFEANYGPKLDMRALRAAAQALHDASVPLDEAKQRMMDAMEKLTPADIPVVQRELQKMLVKNGPARPVNRAQRRQVKKARRRA